MRLLKKIVMLLNREIPVETLVKRGMKVGSGFSHQQGCFFDPTHCFLITIGDDVTMSLRVTVLAHDASTKRLLGYTKIGQVQIEDHAFIGANVTILPGVRIGEGAVIGAGSVVTHDIPAQTVAAGTPARVICSLADYAAKHRAKMTGENTFGEEYRMGQSLDPDKKREMIAATDGKIAFIR